MTALPHPYHPFVADKGSGPEVASGDLWVKFWGVRGTMPTPGPGTLKYGGHTTCLEVLAQHPSALIPDTPGSSSSTNRPLLLIDGGSGVSLCGDFALDNGCREFHILLSHMHYDHIIGFTKFTPLFRSDCSVHFYGQGKKGKSLRHLVSRIFSFPYFPVEFKELKAKMTFTEINDMSSRTICNHLVEFQLLNHPQEAVAFRIWNRQKTASFVFATDHEHGTQKDKELAKFAHQTELFICDATYTEEGYRKSVGWGHATAAAGARIAKTARAKTFGICHHDPSSTDEFLEKILLPEAAAIFENSFLCRETDVVRVSTQEK